MPFGTLDRLRVEKVNQIESEQISVLSNKGFGAIINELEYWFCYIKTLHLWSNN
jgi:hypothetical protein